MVGFEKGEVLMVGKTILPVVGAKVKNISVGNRVTMKYFFLPRHAFFLLTLLFVLSSVSADATQHLAVTDDNGKSRPLLSLSELEPFVAESPESLIAAAEIEESLQRLERQRAVNGLEIFGGTGIGHYREAVTADKMRDYDRIRLFLGLRYPLLGSRAQQRMHLLKAEETAWQSQQQKKFAHLKSLAALRSQYALLWGTQKKIEISETFLSDKDRVLDILAQRTRKGLLLEADRQEFLTVFDLIRRNIANLQAAKKRTLANINLLTNRHAGHFIATDPDLPRPELDRVRLHALALNNHPDIVRLRGVVEKQLGILHLAHHSDVKARVSLTGHTDTDFPSNDNGYGLSLQFTMDAPWEFSRAAKAERASEQARLLKLQRELDRASSQLLTDVDDDIERYRAAEENRRFAARRVGAALETVRERQLRRDSLAGETFELLQQSRYAYYQTAMDYVDAEVLLLQAAARLLAVTDDDPLSGGRAKPQLKTVVDETYLQPFWQQHLPDYQRQVAPAPVRVSPDVCREDCLGVYVWNTRKLFADERSQTDFWKKTREQGICRLLLSFDRTQLEELKRPVARQRLQRFLHRARAIGVTVGLLLAEPTWILPEHRENLLTIIGDLKDFDFSLIHLDLEPNQLEHLDIPEDDLLAHLLRTVQAVTRLTTLPVEVDLHPRYLTGDVNDFCLGCGLENLDGVSVTLMIYVNDTARVADVTGRIRDRFPALPLAVAQSVERHIIPGEEQKIANGREDAQSQAAAVPDAVRMEFKRVIDSAVAPRFGHGKGELTPSLKADLRRLAAALKGKRHLKIAIVGHTDSDAMSKKTAAIYGDNFGLGQARADATADYLAPLLKLERKEIKTSSRGALDPLVANDTAEGRAKNRRVEIFVSYTQPTVVKVAAPSVQADGNGAVTKPVYASADDFGSYAGLSKQQFREKMKTLKQQLGDGTGCIYVQSWLDYMDMKDEN